MENRFLVLEDENSDTDWSEVCKIVVDAGKEKLGLKRKTSKIKWFDAGCKMTAERRKICHMKWLEDRNNHRKREDFRQARSVAVSMNRRKKRQALERELDDIERNRLLGH